MPLAILPITFAVAGEITSKSALSASATCPISDDLKKYLLSFEMVIFDTDKVTNDDIRNKYIKKSIKSYITQGSQNPIKFINC